MGTALTLALILSILHQAYWSIQFFKLAAELYSKDFGLTERKVIFKYGTGILLYAATGVVQLVLVAVLAFRWPLWPRLGLLVVGIGAVLTLVRSTRLPRLWTQGIGMSYVRPLQEILLDYATDETLKRLQGHPESLLTPDAMYHRMVGPLHQTTSADRILSGLRVSLILPIAHSIAEASPGLTITDDGIKLSDDIFEVMHMDPTIYAEQGIDAFLEHAKNGGRAS